MEHIRKAIERAKGPLGAGSAEDLDSKPVQFRPNVTAPPSQVSPNDVALNAEHLETKRIIAHDVVDPRSRFFDMLRTQVLQPMDMKSWQFLGVTSATEGCGKSLVATNLALSIARQPERSVLLVDMDLRKPQVASCLGLNCDRGLLSALQNRTNLQNSLVAAHVKNLEVLVLPCEAPTLSSSEWVASRAMRDLLNQIKQDFRAWTVIFDLPPLLASDDVISLLPQLDCVLFVVGAGVTTAEEIKECNRHLESAEIVRVVLNKAEDETAAYYAYAAPPADTQKAPVRKGSAKRSRFKPFSKLLNRLGQI
jgi:protein-tyrosine kinase